jgi:NADH-quinone oxidoreductase subunit A
MYNFLIHNFSLATEQTAFLYILLSILAVIVLTAGANWMGSWLRPHNYNSEKLTTYESGIAPVGDAWGPINSRLYLLGLVFILFELETILLFPWATVWIKGNIQQSGKDSWEFYMAMAGTLFIIILGLGLVYAIIKGYAAFSGLKEAPRQIVTNGKIPRAYYEKINAKYATPQPTANNHSIKPI